MVAPWVLMVVLTPLRICRRGWGSYQTSLLAGWYLLHPTVTREAARVFSCSEPVDGARYLLADFSVACDTLEHTVHVLCSAATILVFCIGFPLGTLLAL